MSYVTSVTIVVDYASRKFEAAVTAESDFGRGEARTHLRSLDMGTAGGTKYPGHRVFAAGLNYADRATLIVWVESLPWSEYTSGVVLINTEGQDPEALVFGIAPKVSDSQRSAEGAA